MKCSSRLKKHSTPLTLKWLDTRYEPLNGGSLARNYIYSDYINWCQSDFVQPINAASFGKIIRKHFPMLTTRRLGARGNSKYHYYGIGLKQFLLTSCQMSPRIASSVELQEARVEILEMGGGGHITFPHQEQVGHNESTLISFNPYQNIPCNFLAESVEQDSSFVTSIPRWEEEWQWDVLSS